MLELIAFDADDTLWHSEILYVNSQERILEILSPYSEKELTRQELYRAELPNLSIYGYGIKGFALSMIEAAIRLSDSKIRGSEVEQIIDLAKDMMKAPVRLLEGAAEAVEALSNSYPLMLITKGDLFDQERKITQSGLAAYFKHIEIVSEKTVDVYRSVLAKHGVDPSGFLMIGNSPRSDILPVIELGARAVLIPYHTTWVHEAADAVGEAPMNCIELEHIGLLPAFIEQLAQDSQVGAR
jgi:putative hydrolase of the HAD superfamily